MKKGCLFLLFFAVVQIAFCQTKQEFLDYIAKYKATALGEMVRCGIPASITLAQGIHESSCGRSPLSREANNHFGIKCKDEWDGKKYYQNDDKPNECFRVYEHAEASYADHSDFLVTRPRYADLFKLSITDYKSWARGLKECGYATNPKYAQILINEIEQYQLDAVDREGLAMISEKEKLMAYSGTSSSAPVVATASATPTYKEPAKKENAITKVVASIEKPFTRQTAPKQTATIEKPVTKETTPTKEVASVEKPAAKETATKEVEVTRTSFFDSPNKEPQRKEYMVNGALALIAKENEDPLKVAFDYNIDYNYILMFNDLEQGEHFKEGEHIFLQAKKNRGTEEFYTVKKGESMREISQKTGVKLRDLYTKNTMKANEQACVGETLNLKDRRTSTIRTMPYADFLKSQTTASVTPASVAPVVKQQPQTETATVSPTPKPVATTHNDITYNTQQYQVQPSDTLYSIARKFNTTVEELKNLNNLETTSVQAGQKLVVSK